LRYWPFSFILTPVMNEMPKAYEPQGKEDALYEMWQKSGYFNPDNLPDVENRKESFSIVLPPPNVTGTLHLGHASMLAIEDAMVRYARLSGKRTLWIPGTDHAAIATQSKVEKMIFESEKKSRYDLGREAFLERVRAFAQESHDTIVNQVKKMGASIDWSREAYTLDEKRNKAVNVAFKRMYDDGLIYRGYRVVNWDPIGQTTIADDEIVYKETTAKLYTFKYSKDFPVSISTTRPETKVGDTAVAVHPKGKYKKFIGQSFDVEFAGTKLNIKIVGDEGVDPEFGTGALGVTPAHSSIDFDIAKRNNLEMIQVIGEDGKMMPSAGPLVSGLSTKSAREKVVEWLRENNLLESEEESAQNLSTAERTGGVIEPLPKLQWFIDVNKEFDRDGKMVTLKSLMQNAVRSKAIDIMPDRFEKTYFHWIDNLRDWNISRQIWFGHRVPVWYKGEEIMVGSAPEGEGWGQDEDTLDTWFSSGLWTFSTLGWPDETEDLKRFHPTTVLETGYDILFFWVARMILMSTYLVNDVPFKTVYLHGLVRDEQGRKMSKSLGNIINPLDMIEKYGADATRLSLVLGNTPGNDLKLSEEKIAGFRNFTNKLWNISRFILTKAAKVQHIESVEPKTLADRWILGRFSEVVEKVTKHQEAYDLSMAGEILRDFTWNEFADWYLEIAKIEGEKDDILLYILERLLILWHPYMPFVTEEIYKNFDKGLIIVAKWPSDTKFKLTAEDEKQFGAVQEIVAAIRNVRAEYKIAPKDKIQARLIGGDHLKNELSIIAELSRVDVLSLGDDGLPAVKVAAGGVTVAVDVAGSVDSEKEQARLSKEIESTEKYVKSVEAKLAGDFSKNAPEKIVLLEKAKLEEAQKKLETLKAQIESLPKA
jgi:valyl-tRNA synthetase